MSCKDLLDIYFRLTTRFDFLWNFYTFFVIALSGYILTKHEVSWTVDNKIAILAGYSLFVMMNIFALIATSKALRATAEAIYQCLATSEPRDISVVRVLVRRNHHLDNLATFGVHSVMLVLVIALIMLK